MTYTPSDYLRNNWPWPRPRCPECEAKLGGPDAHWHYNTCGLGASVNSLDAFNGSVVAATGVRK